MALTDQEIADGKARPASISTRDGRSVKRVAAVRRRHSAELVMDTCFASRRDSAELATRRDAGEACGGSSARESSQTHRQSATAYALMTTALAQPPTWA